MKTKNILTTTIIALSLLISTACRKDGICERGDGPTVTREIVLDDIEGIDMDIDADVYIKQDNVQKIEVKGQSDIIDRLKRNTFNKVWKIGFTRCVKHHDKLEIHISVPSLKSINLSGSGNIQGENTFTSNNLKLRISGSGNISIAANVASLLDANISGSGSITVAGTGNQQDLRISGSGDIHGLEFAAKSADINISGSGDVETNSTDKLDVHISGSGDVYYKNTPAINTSVSGSGNVKHVN